MRLWLLFAGLIFLGSCISNKKVTLLQKQDVNKKGTSLPMDTVVRSYQSENFQYKVQSNDIISVRFESLTDKEFDFLSVNAQASNTGALAQGGALLIGELVDNNGEIPIPVIGKVKVAGLTVFEIQDKLTTEAARYIQSPVVRVRLINYRITILGEVNREGAIILTNNRVSMLEAIGLAGGLGELADRTKIKLIRQVDGKTDVQYIDLSKESFLESPYYYVYQNDVLVVPPLRQRPFRRYFGQNLSLFVSTVSVILLTINLLQN